MTLPYLFTYLLPNFKTLKKPQLLPVVAEQGRRELCQRARQLAPALRLLLGLHRDRRGARRLGSHGQRLLSKMATNIEFVANNHCISEIKTARKILAIWYISFILSASLWINIEKINE